MRYTKVQTPRGVKDILPREADVKTRIERMSADFIEGWGYDRIITPTFEFYDALKQGERPVGDERLYRFVDRDGTTLALRPEMTVPIARVAATRYRPEDMPLRLYYVGSVFRYDEPQEGRHREFTQVGVELLGAESRWADAEVVVLTAGLFEHLGLGSFRLDLGHVAYFAGLIEDIAAEPVAGELRDALLDRDYVRYEALVQGGGFPSQRQEALRALPTLRGGWDTVAAARELADGMPTALAALDELVQVYRLVKSYGLENRIGIDLGMIKHVDYYSGMQIEGYAPELGFTLCTGGRYDHLIGRYGRDYPATGFAFSVERLMLALERQGNAAVAPAGADLCLHVEDGDGTQLFAAAAELRAVGVRVQAVIDAPYEAVAEADGSPSARGATRDTPGLVQKSRPPMDAVVRSGPDGDMQFFISGGSGQAMTSAELAERVRQTIDEDAS